MVIGSLPPSLYPFLSFFPHFSTYVVGDIPENVDVPPVAVQVHFRDGFHGSNSVEIMHDSGHMRCLGLLILMMIALLES